MDWKKNEKYTIIGISPMMAMTTKNEVICVEPDHEGKPAFRKARKRKCFTYRWTDKDMTELLVFEGWNIPLKIDSEQDYGADGSKVMCGNACYNFLGTTEHVKEMLKLNLNKTFSNYAAVLAHGDRVDGNDESATPVFPEKPTTHAVVLRIREKKGMLDKAPEVVYSYGQEEAIEDGVLMENPKRDKFPECSIVTTNLFEKIQLLADQRNQQRVVFETDALEQLGCLMLFAKDIYDNKKFTGDNDENFFVVPGNESIEKVWFVRNEYGKLTAMLPEDY